MTFGDAVRGLLNGDFSRLEPQFRPGEGGAIPLLEWHAAGEFAAERAALAEAFTCACFNGCEEVVDYLLARGAHPDGGRRTGMTAFHWAANRGQLGVVEKLIRAGASLEEKNNYGGTVLSCTVWSFFNEPRPAHLDIIATLLAAGARASEVPAATGDARIDEMLARHRA